MHNTRLIVFACLALSLLPGCSRLADSRLNPMNWFTAKQAEITQFSIQRPADPRPMIEMIVNATVEPLPTGALVRATGRAATQGYWQADLVVNGLDKDGNLIIEFRAIPALASGPETPPKSREITAAVSLRADTFASAKRIVLRGAQNEISLRP